MDTVAKIFSILGPIIGLATASPITAGIFVIAAAIGAFFLVRAFKQAQWKAAHKAEVTQAAKDSQDQIAQNQQASVGDAKTIEQGEKDKQKLIEEFAKKPGAK